MPGSEYYDCKTCGGYIFDCDCSKRLPAGPYKNDAPWDKVNKMTGKPLDKQIGGDHYKSAAIQPIEVIRDWDLNFETGNAIKYIARHKLKGEPKKDIEKAIHYLEMYRETLE